MLCYVMLFLLIALPQRFNRFSLLAIPLGMKGYKNSELAEHLDKSLRTRADSASSVVKAFHLTSTYLMVSTSSVVKAFHLTSTYLKVGASSVVKAFDLSQGQRIKFVVPRSQCLQEVGGLPYYARACNLLRDMTQAYDDALATYDVLLMPTMSYVAPKQPRAPLSVTGAYRLV